MTTIDDSWDDDHPLDCRELDDGELDDEYAEVLELPRAPLPRPGAVLASEDEVHRHLLALVGPECDGPRSLWILLLDATHRVQPLVIPLDDLPVMPDEQLVSNLATMLRSLLEGHLPGGSVAFGLVRSAGGDRGASEGRWSRALRAAMSSTEVPVRAVVAIGRDRSRVLPVDA
ncbi:hypothetical protein [Cellulomonas fimi]|uniref:Uncharacterized protein n=1 Tax=Cellulomonas fimi TaxID=1708 RepID=A0A7Y0QJM6_CELFI|nr:hypothetical protein [Cellulomonas fimi]NMR21512.1 hypothetical protein [Cellulomonas fimi]